MLTAAEATKAILAAVNTLESETVSLAAATGRVLAQSVKAERDQPPFDRVMMDGIAIAYAEFADGNRSFQIQSTQAAGDPAQTLKPAHAIEIMTGASLPAGADCIIPVERITVNESGAHVEANYATSEQQFVHAAGSDHKKDTELLQPGTRISPMDIAIIASCGLANVSVSKQPRISVISTGNELIAAGEAIAAHQIRLSNGPAIVAMLEENGYADATHEHLVDEPELLRERIAQHLQHADVLILSGGVSMGRADYVPQVLHDLGVEVTFHKISQRPGKPMWFGMGPDGQAVFALPGNPVSTLVCARQYVIPALRHMSGMAAAAPQFASLTTEVTFKPQLTNFLPVKLISNAAGNVLAMPVHTNTSGDFASLSGTDGYVELALEQSDFKTGTTVPLHRWRM
ncbi:MAG: molybdopterin molybdotransferase MoeA [Proteobacteria bacterium]|nr:molybdopterin molybdotransferase MoeA [Pseudomonadota bacterium]